MNNRRISIAPMMGYTDRHFRQLARLLSRHVLLYTEMVTTAQLLHGDVPRALRYYPEEHPLALQLGGSDPKALKHCARLGEDFGYDEINLNVGCPSDRVQSGAFGACLMKQPERVAQGIAAMQDAVDIPVIASGGVGALQHLVDGVTRGGADAVLAASIFHFGEYTIGEAKEFMSRQGITMRL